MVNKKQTSAEVAAIAAEILKDENASDIAKKLAGSALSQTATSRQTSAEMEDLASKVLKSDKYNATTKTLAASILSQSNKGR